MGGCRAKKKKKLYRIFIINGDTRKNEHFQKRICSVRKRQINTCCAPNCSATIIYFRISALEICTLLHHQLAPVSLKAILQYRIFWTCSIRFESPCIRLHNTSLRADLGYACSHLKALSRRHDVTEPDANTQIRRTYHLHSASSRWNISNVCLSVISATYSEQVCIQYWKEL